MSRGRSSATRRSGPLVLRAGPAASRRRTRSGRPAKSVTRPLEDPALLHHEDDPLHDRNVLERVTGDGDHVGDHVRPDRAEPIVHLEETGGDFRLRDFFDRLNRIDSIPIALGRWEMTGLDDGLRPPGTVPPLPEVGN